VVGVEPNRLERCVLVSARLDLDIGGVVGSEELRHAVTEIDTSRGERRVSHIGARRCDLEPCGPQERVPSGVGLVELPKGRNGTRHAAQLLGESKVASDLPRLILEDGLETLEVLQERPGTAGKLGELVRTQDHHGDDRNQRQFQGIDSEHGSTC
jgi:hypothetical protein